MIGSIIISCRINEYLMWKGINLTHSSRQEKRASNLWHLVIKPENDCQPQLCGKLIACYFMIFANLITCTGISSSKLLCTDWSLQIRIHLAVELSFWLPNQIGTEMLKSRCNICTPPFSSCTRQMTNVCCWEWLFLLPDNLYKYWLNSVD